MREQVAAVIIAIPSLNHKTLRGLYETARESKVSSVKVVPRIYDFDRPDINLKGLEDISIEDLIGRQVVSVDYRSIRTFLEGKVVLISGAGGSIGMEIVTQVFSLSIRGRWCSLRSTRQSCTISVCGLDRLFPQLAGRIVYVTGDISDEGRVREVFGRYTPKIVFHAAAYKHVPMMEYNPREAARVNIFGTRNIARGRGGMRDRELCDDLYRQGRAAHQCDGGHKADGRIHLPDLQQGGRERIDEIHVRPLWECAGK